MDVAKMLADLKDEREQIEEAILTLERLAQGRGKRRGRPPLWLVEARKRNPDGLPVAAPAAPVKVSSKTKTASAGKE
jgi:hypothetical protein